VDDDLDFYARHSAFSDPGDQVDWLDTVPPDIAEIRRAAGRMVFHYRAHGPLEPFGIPSDRMDEINLRYADDMLRCIRGVDPAPLVEDRAPRAAMVGCCRDFTLLFLTLARHHGFPARARVGFASYFAPGWYVDHAVPEVWVDGCWVLMEPEIDPGYVDPTDGAIIDPEHVSRGRFLVGPAAWSACRSGDLPAEKFVVSPDLHIPQLRGWPYLLHNLVLDLAALSEREMILWDTWGVMDLGRDPEPELPERMDAVAATLLDPSLTVSEVQRLAAEEGLAIPETVNSWDPVTGAQMLVSLR
jgi:hypothetical protein